MLARLEKVVRYFGVVCTGLLFVLVIVQVILRYAFGHTHFLTEELGRYLLIWASLAGMSIETRRRGHIRVSFLVERLPDVLFRVWQIILDVLVLILFLVLVYTGIDSTIFNNGQESSGMQIPLSIPFSAIPIFFTISAVFMAERIWRYKAGRQ